MAALHGCPTRMHARYIVLVIAIGSFFILPVGIIAAISNQEVSFNMAYELIIGYILPSHPIITIIFKTTMFTVTPKGCNLQWTKSWCTT